MISHTRERILHDLRDLLRDFNGKEYSGDVGLETLLFADLGMVSIDAVILAETLERFYKREFSFSQFLAEIGREGIGDIPLGRLVAFLDDQMNACPGEGQLCR
jgi:acyl carrier protein